MDKFDPWEKFHNRFICSEVKKFRYGLRQSVRIAHDTLVKHLAPYMNF